MKNLLSIEDLTIDEIEKILERAQAHTIINRQANKSQNTLVGRTLINLFVENSTRTLTSFELAAKRLGADVITMNVEKSSITVKGESLIDTAMTLNAMHPDFIVVRHNLSGQVRMLAENVDCAVINAGDGTNEHPTQALVDAATITNAKGGIVGLNVAICGDILHSRVARSNILLLTKMGANVRVIAPKVFLPDDNSLQEKGVEVFTSMKKGLEDVDVVMMLRVQKERMQTHEIPSPRDFYKEFGLSVEKLAYAKPDAKVMHPGPINRGVEIASEVADNRARSLILEQVEMGVPVRQALLEHLAS
jgi:aspartate carbamoyltransferase catalytic subunit